MPVQEKVIIPVACDAMFGQQHLKASSPRVGSLTGKILASLRCSARDPESLPLGSTHGCVLNSLPCPTHSSLCVTDALSQPDGMFYTFMQPTYDARCAVLQDEVRRPLNDPHFFAEWEVGIAEPRPTQAGSTSGLSDCCVRSLMSAAQGSW